jgi:hypothetical protein
LEKIGSRRSLASQQSLARSMWWSISFWMLIKALLYSLSSVRLSPKVLVACLQPHNINVLWQCSTSVACWQTGCCCSNVKLLWFGPSGHFLFLPPAVKFFSSSVQYTVCTFSVVQYSWLILLVSRTTIQRPCIVLGYTGRLVIQ